VALDPTGSPRFEIVADVAYDYIDPEATDPLDVPEPAKLVYFGTLAQRTPGGLDRIQRLLRRKPAGALGYLDINLRKNGYGKKSVEASLEQADILKLNEEELEILGRMFSPKSDTASFREWLMERFGIRLMALTRGERGAAVFTHEGESLTVQAVPVDRVKDTVGAGDAFAAVLAVGYLRGVSLRKVLSTAVSFSARICGVEGALPDDPAIYRTAAAAMEEKNHVR
jgi:fructokinase